MLSCFCSSVVFSFGAGEMRGENVIWITIFVNVLVSLGMLEWNVLAF